MHACQHYTHWKSSPKWGKPISWEIFLSLSHFLSFYQTWTTDNQPPTHPPLLCVCSVAISKSISCHFSFLPSQFCFLHPAQGDKACSMVWRSNLCTFLVEYSPSRGTRRCYVLDGVVVDCVNHTISVSLHSAAGGDVFGQAAPSLLFPTCSLSVHDNKIHEMRRWSHVYFCNVRCVRR